MLIKTVNEVCGEILHTLSEKLNAKLSSFTFDTPIIFKTADIAPLYYDKKLKITRDVEMTELYHSAFQWLGDEGLVELWYSDSLGVFEKLSVASAQAQSIFSRADIIPRFQIIKAVQHVIQEYQNSPYEHVRTFITKTIKNDFKGFRYGIPTALEARIRKERPLTVRDYSNYWRDVLRGAEAILGLQEDVLIKNLSKDLYGDSKALERFYKPEIVRLLEPEQCSDNVPAIEILTQHHVFTVQTFARIRGSAILTFADGHREDLASFRSSLALSVEQIKLIIACDCTSILTIENPTVFESLPIEPGVAFVNTYGYADTVVIALVNKLMKCSGIECIEHFGDLDPDGFKISRALESSLTVGCLHRRWMNVVAFPLYRGLAKMEAWQRRQFESMLSDPYYTPEDKALFQLLLANNVVAEQEGFRLDTTQTA